MSCINYWTMVVAQKLRVFSLLLPICLFLAQGCSGTEDEAAPSKASLGSASGQYYDFRGSIELGFDDGAYRWQLLYEFDGDSWHAIEYFPTGSPGHHAYLFRADGRADRLIVSQFGEDSIAEQQFTLQKQVGGSKAWKCDGVRTLELRSGHVIEMTFAKGVMHGPFQILRADNTVELCGQFCSGEVCGKWVSTASDGSRIWAIELGDSTVSTNGEKRKLVREALGAWSDELELLNNSLKSRTKSRGNSAP